MLTPLMPLMPLMPLSSVGGAKEIVELICGTEISCDAYVVCECYAYDAYELLEDYQFDCGLEYFGFDPGYPAELTSVVPGEIHLQSSSAYGSLVPDLLPNTNDGKEYICRVKVKNIVGDGKLSASVDGTWQSVLFDAGDGIYETTFTGDLGSIQTGANADDTFNADFEFLSLRLSSDPAPQAVLVDDSGNMLVDDSGRVLTADIK